MKGKSILSTLIIALLLIGVAMVPTTLAVPVESLDVIFVETGTTSLAWQEDGRKIGDSFTVNIVATNTMELFSWEAGLKWDPSYLIVTAASFGEFTTLSQGGLQLPGSDPFEGVDNTAGTLSTYGETSTNLAVTEASVTLLTLTFQTVAFPPPEGTVIEITNALVVNGGEFTTGFALNHGTFTFTPIPNVAPTADFTILPAPPYYAPIELTFDGTGSYDPDGTVVSWEWTIKKETATIATSTDSVFSYNFIEPGDYSVTLIVTDDGKLPYYDPLPSDPVTKSITVYEVLLSYIDVYTELKGVGPNAYGSAFEPGQEVTISADLMYAGVPVDNVVVSFQLKDRTGDDVTYRTAKTVSGTATIKVRLPLMGTEHLTDEADFGLFTCIATAVVYEESFNDTVSLYVGWVVDTVDVTPASTSVARGGTVTLTVNTENYALETQSVYLTVTIYDSVGVAVGVSSISFTISAASYVGLDVTPYLDTRDFTVTIPLEAWPGPATAYANAYDKSPFEGGDAWCTEISTSFSIA